MIGIDRARLLGTLLSGKSVTVNFGFGPYDGMFKGGYEMSRERKVVMASRKDLLPIGITAGEFKPGMLGFEFAEQTALMVQEALANLDPNGTSYGDATGWTTTFALNEPTAQGTPILYTFRGCWWASDSGDYPTTADELKANFKIGFLQPDKNGLTLYSSQS